MAQKKIAHAVRGHRAARPRLDGLGFMQWTKALAGSTQGYHYRGDIGRYLATNHPSPDLQKILAMGPIEDYLIYGRRDIGSSADPVAIPAR